jgi:hypothetical protein
VPPEELYELLWQKYQEGLRTRDALAQACGCRTRTASTAIRFGWPEKGWPSLRERLVLWLKRRDAVRAAELAQADRVSAEAAGVSHVAAWREFLPKSFTLNTELASFLGVFGQRMREAMKSASFIRYRTVRKTFTDMETRKDGTQVPHSRTLSVSEPYVDGVAIAKAGGGPRPSRTTPRRWRC